MQENLSEAAEKLASRLVRQWGEELRRSIAEELQPVLEAEITRAGHEAAFVIASDLIRLLQAANQVEILTVLLQTTQPFAARAGLLILRGGFFMGWQSRGMRDASAFTRISIPANDRAIERLAKERQPMRLQASEVGDVFASAAPAGPGDIYFFPLLIRDRLAGVVYADGGLTDSVVQVEVVQAMSLIACIAVETASLRKPAGSGAMQSGTNPEPVRPSPAVAMSRPEPPPAAIPTVDPVVAAPPVAVATKDFAAAAPAATVPLVAAQSNDVHAKAKRFAKLLVEEIQLYNQVKVAEGRSKRDLYERLRPDIEKSRAAYQKRYGGVIRDADYFSEELVRILAGNDRALLGSSFPG
ncbi:MAG: hypothetical protein ABSD96_17355 [Candidatus Korobacteraceae bacterium]